MVFYPEDGGSLQATRRYSPDYHCDNLKTNLLFVISQRPMGSAVYSVVRCCKIHDALCLLH
jgi:hypothetical protein